MTGSPSRCLEQWRVIRLFEAASSLSKLRLLVLYIGRLKGGIARDRNMERLDRSVNGEIGERGVLKDRGGGGRWGGRGRGGCAVDFCFCGF